MKKLVLRNLKIFFRDKTAVFFSFLSVLIIIGLYALFLEKSLTSGYGNTPGIPFLINSWLSAGILTVTSVTTSLGALGTLVDDRARKIEQDFAASPVPRWKIAGGYILCAFLVGLLLSVAAFVLLEGFIVLNGGEFLALGPTLQLLGLLVLSSFSGSAMNFFLVSLLNSRSAYGTASTVIGSLIGFFTGIYVPMGNLPDPVQAVIRVFPLSHVALLMRQILMKKPISVTFAGAPEATVEKFRLTMGVAFRVGGKDLAVGWSLFYLLASAFLFCGLSVRSVRRKRKE